MYDIFGSPFTCQRSRANKVKPPRQLEFQEQWLKVENTEKQTHIHKTYQDFCTSKVAYFDLVSMWINLHRNTFSK